MVGISINTKLMPPESANAYLKEMTDEHNLPCVDPLRTGVSAIVDYIKP